MDIDLRPYAGEARQYLEAVELAFSEPLRDDGLEYWQHVLEVDRAIAAYDGERIVGTAAAFTFTLTVPGGTVPCAGVTMVGVHPTHRRRGVLRRAMRLQLDDVRRRGEPVAALWASEGSIYGRFGYGLASLKARVRVERHRNAFRRGHEPAGTVRWVTRDDAKELFPPVYDTVRLERPGSMSRSRPFWDAEVFHVPEHWRRGLGPPFYAVHEASGRIDGYVIYAIREGRDESEVSVTELAASDPGARLDLWRFVLDIDLMDRLEAWNVAVDDPILLSVAEPRKLNATLGDALWVRLVDLPAALAARRYAGAGRVVLEVTDEFCPWNAGTWVLEVEDGHAHVAPSEQPADLALDVADLAAVYLGAFTFAALADALRVAELSSGALARADRLFRTDRAPYCVSTF